MNRMELYDAFRELSDFQQSLVIVDIFSKFQCKEEYGYDFTAEQFFNIIEKAVSPKQSEYVEDDVHLREEDLYDESKLA